MFIPCHAVGSMESNKKQKPRNFQSTESWNKIQRGCLCSVCVVFEKVIEMWVVLRNWWPVLGVDFCNVSYRYLLNSGILLFLPFLRPFQVYSLSGKSGFCPSFQVFSPKATYIPVLLKGVVDICSIQLFSCRNWISHSECEFYTVNTTWLSDSSLDLNDM